MDGINQYLVGGRWGRFRGWEPGERFLNSFLTVRLELLQFCGNAE